jgi:selenophosphate synthetase-related protein
MHLGFQHWRTGYLSAIFLYIVKQHTTRKIVVILFSPEINFKVITAALYIEYFKTISFTKYKYNTI